LDKQRLSKPLTEIETARAQLDAGDLDAAEASCRAILRFQGADSQALCILGIVALLRKNYSDAIGLFGKSLESGYVADTLLLNNYGEAYRRLGRLDEAFDCFSEALHLDTQQPYSYFNIALIRRVQGNARESEHYFRLALLVKPDLIQAHTELAELYFEEGHFHEAIEEYREALAQAVAPAAEHGVSSHLLCHWHGRLASLLLLQGATMEAVSTAEEALALDRNNADAWHELAKAKFELCHEGEAIRSYQRAVELSPGLSVHAKPRVFAVRRRMPVHWSAGRDGSFVSLARPYPLQIAPPPTIPVEFSERFLVGPSRLPELFSLRLANAEVLPRDFAVITEDHTLLLDGIVNRVRQYERNSPYVKHGSDDMRMLLDLAADPVVHEGPCILLGGAGDQYAWYFEALARLWAVEQQPKLAVFPVAVHGDITEARLADLALFGYPRERLVLVESGRGAKFAELYVPSLCVADDCISPLAVQFLRRRLLPAARGGRRRIYLSRGNCDVRRLANEAEILPLLRANRFEVLDVANIPGDELIRAFGDAEAVLAMEDETLARLVVAPQGTHVGVIATEGIYNPRGYLLSSQLAHDFVYLVGVPVFESHEIHEKCDVRLPVESLRRFLDRL
jgi:tetratricopeptide (TPR) repeat protein